VILASLLVVAFAAGVIIYALMQPSKAEREKIAGEQSFSFASGQHTSDTVPYKENPPAGGPHDPAWQNCGIYDAPVKNENAVHALEHGAVWITYRPDLPPDQIEKLRSIATNPYDLLSPYPNLPAPVVVSAWGKQVQMTGPDDERLEKFLRKYRQGPQTPEPGASCSGGVGQPVG